MAKGLTNIYRMLLNTGPASPLYHRISTIYTESIDIKLTRQLAF